MQSHLHKHVDLHACNLNSRQIKMCVCTGSCCPRLSEYVHLGQLGQWQLSVTLCRNEWYVDRISLNVSHGDVGQNWTGESGQCISGFVVSFICKFKVSLFALEPQFNSQLWIISPDYFLHESFLAVPVKRGLPMCHNTTIRGSWRGLVAT